MPSAAKISIVLMFLCAFSWSVLADAAAKPDIVSFLPADTLNAIVVRSFRPTLKNIDQFAEGALPFPVQLSSLVDSMLQEMWGQSNPPGIDLDGSVAMITMHDTQTKTDATFLWLAVSDRNALTASDACKPTDHADIFQILKPDTDEPRVFLALPTDVPFAILSSADELPPLKKLAESLKNPENRLAWTLEPAHQKAAQAAIWVSFDIQQINRYYREDIAASLRALRNVPDGGLFTAAQAGRATLSLALEELIGQTDRVSVSLEPQIERLQAQAVLTAAKNTPLRGMLSADAPKDLSLKLAGLADDANAVNILASLPKPFIAGLTQMALDILARAPETPFSASDIQTLKDLFEKANQSEISTAFWGVNDQFQPPFFGFSQAQQVSNPNYLVENSPAGIQAANLIYEKLQIPLRLEMTEWPDKINGLVVYQSKVSRRQIDTADKTEKEQADMVDIQGDLDSMIQFHAQKGDIVFSAQASHPDALKALLNKPMDAPPTGDLKKAIDALGKSGLQSHLIASVNLARLMTGWSKKMMASDTPNGSANPPASATTESCLAISMTMAQGAFQAAVVLPKAHLAETVKTSFALQKQWLDAQDKQPAPSAGETMSDDDRKPLQDWLGKPMPNLALTDLQGNAIQISDLKGKKVIIDVWATWCPPCKKMLPELIAARKSLPAESVVIIGISNEPKDRLAEFAQKAQINYPIVALSDPLPAPLDEIRGLPTLIFIDTQGVIRRAEEGWHSQEQIKTLLQTVP